MNVEQATLPIPGESPAPTTSSVAIADGSCSAYTNPLVEVQPREGYLILAPPHWPAQACPKGKAKARPPGLEAGIEAQPKSLAARALDNQEATVHESRNASMNRRESSCERSRTAWIRRTMLGRPSSSNINLSTADAELVAVNAAVEEALTESLRMCQRAGEEEAEIRAEKIRKEQEEDDARYFHMLREQASGRLKLFMPTEDYRWFKYCFQGYELPDGQSAQQILNMAAVHDEIPLAAKAASAKRWIKELSNIEAVWQHNHGADYWRLAQ